MSDDQLLARVQPVGGWHVSVDGQTLVAEPHHMLLVIGETQIRLTDCRCDECARLDASFFESPLIPPAEVAAALLENGNDSLAIAPHRDLLLPLEDGEPADCLALVAEYAEALAAAGVAVELVELVDASVGEWLHSTGYWAYGPEQVLVPGLLARVVPDPYGICTPGVTVYVVLEGAEEPFGYPDGLLEPTGSEPRPEELAEARRLYGKALEIFEDEHGWSGYLKLGKGRPRAAVEARTELAGLAAKLGEDRAVSDLRGLTKRARRILAGFADRADSDEARGLLDRMNAASSAEGLDCGLLADLRGFASHPVKGEPQV